MSKIPRLGASRLGKLDDIEHSSEFRVTRILLLSQRTYFEPRGQGPIGCRRCSCLHSFLLSRGFNSVTGSDARHLPEDGNRLFALQPEAVNAGFVIHGIDTCTGDGQPAEVHPGAYG